MINLKQLMLEHPDSTPMYVDMLLSRNYDYKNTHPQEVLTNLSLNNNLQSTHTRGLFWDNNFLSVRYTGNYGELAVHFINGLSIVLFAKDFVDAIVLRLQDELADEEALARSDADI
jgi:hypothetical protein